MIKRSRIASVVVEDATRVVLEAPLVGLNCDRDWSLAGSGIKLGRAPSFHLDPATYFALSLRTLVGAFSILFRGA